MTALENRIEKIKNGPEQLKMMAAERRSWWQTIGLGVSSGLLISYTYQTFGEVSIWLTISIALLTLVLLLWAESIAHHSAVAGKVQDRRFFLTCIREAKDVDELNEAGLFAYLPSHSFSEQEQKVKITESKNKLLHALNAGQGSDSSTSTSTSNAAPTESRLSIIPDHLTH